MVDEEERTISLDELVQVVVDRVAVELKAAAQDMYKDSRIDSRIRDVLVTAAENLHS